MFARLRLFLQDRRKEVVIWLLFFLISTMSFALGVLVTEQNNSGRVPIIIQKGESTPLQ